MQSHEKKLTLEPDKVEPILKPGGALCLSLKNFEPREQQQQMLLNVLESYNKSRIALIEAGTGTGKSMAYLIPSLLWGVINDERTVISTATINLQEQLFHKDIPLIKSALNLGVKAVLVKGMGNYICKRRLEEASYELRILPPEEAADLARIQAWEQTTHDGSKSSMNFSPLPQVWESVCAEYDSCNKDQCHHYKQCHFFAARKEATDAKILIVNHHLLFSDLSTREGEEGLLPYYTRVIIDEAHNIEDIATDFFASKLSTLNMLKLLSRLMSEKHGKNHGKLPQLKNKLENFYKGNHTREVSSILNRLQIDLPGMRRDLVTQFMETFNAMNDFINNFIRDDEDDEKIQENKLRILSTHAKHDYWLSHIHARSKKTSNAIGSFVEALNALDNDIKGLKEERLTEQTKGILFEINTLANRLSGAQLTLEQFIRTEDIPEKVRWIETQLIRNSLNTTIIDADLDVSKSLAKYLFNRFPSVVLCSATLTTNRDFKFIRSRFGLHPGLLEERVVNEHIYDAPYDYDKQALLVVPTDICSPNEIKFTEDAAEAIWIAIQASRGNAFVLFTSYSMLKACFNILEKRLKENRFHTWKQGDDNRRTLLHHFQSTDRSVLFGTDSFWEGVDVAGEALRCVILVKLPFKVPKEPIIEARSEAIRERGGSPFFEYQIPHAIVKFKQGFGRLIRNRKDRGCIVCLDTRIHEKNYGQLFLNSLPPCGKAFVKKEQLFQTMSDFYRKTHYLTKE